MIITTKYIILFIFAAPILAAQDTAAIYFNKDGTVITDKGQATYYRKWIKHDSATGLWEARDCYISNNLRMIGNYKSNKLNAKHGNFVYFFENGQKKKEGEFVDNKAEGIWKYWYDNGAKEGEGSYYADKREDKWIFLHENGNKKSEGSYLYDQKSGVWKYWNLDGKLDIEETYQKGQVIFKLWYHENGSKKTEGYFSDEKKTGEWIYRDIDEKIFLKANYLNGLQHGEWTRYFENNQSMKIYFDNGVLKDKKLGGIVKKE